MISEMLRYILWAAIGSGAGYYVAKKHLEAEYDSRLQVELEQTRKFYKNLYDEKLRRATEVAHNEGAIQAVVDLTGGEDEPDVVELVDVVSPHPDIPEQADEPEEEMSEEAAVALVNYQGISAASAEPVGNLSRIFEKKTVEEPELAYVKPDGPRLIDFDKYAENGGDYEQHTVVYYAADSEASNENDEKLDKGYVGRYISYANIAKLNDQNTTIYVRDDANRIDHEVIWSAGSFAVDVLGEQSE